MAQKTLGGQSKHAPKSLLILPRQKSSRARMIQDELLLSTTTITISSSFSSYSSHYSHQVFIWIQHKLLPLLVLIKFIKCT